MKICRYNSMKRTTLVLILLFITAVATAGNDIWQTLFQEKLQEARQGDSSAQFDVASMYQNGRGVSPDLGRAVEWYEKAAAQNNTKAVNRLKLLEANKERFKKILAQAGKGNAESQYKLGKMYTEGVGTSIDYSRATKAFESSASQGYAKAEYHLGLNYYEGNGVAKSRKTAYKWFLAAADQDHPAAQFYLGKMFASGTYVKQSYTTSLKWFTKAVDGGFNQARAEMIDVTEKMKMEKSAKAEETARTEKAKARADKKAAARAKISRQKKAKKKAVARKKKSATKTSVKKVKSPADTPEFKIEDLTIASWSRSNKPVSYLPSAINNCRREGKDVICYSDSQTRESGSNEIKFKTKSTLTDFSKDGTFNVTYSNLVIDSKPIGSISSGDDDGEVGGEDDSAGSAYKVKTGWGKAHTLMCQLKDSHPITCLKNTTHTFTLVSPRKVASGR